METSSVSLIIATFNHAQFLREALDSALGQTLPGVDIVVVDDGSTDATPTVLAEYGDRIRSLRQPNRGLAAARNAGLSLARGTYVAFLDADDVLASEKLARQAAILDGDDRVGWTYCDVLMADTSTGEVRPASERFRYHHRRLDGWLFPELISGNFIPAIAPLIRRSVLDRAGWFDESLTALEDWDLWLRLSLAAEARYQTDALATYRVHKDGMSQDRARMDRNRFWVVEKVARVNQPAMLALGSSGRRMIADMQNWFGIEAYRRGDWVEATRRLWASFRIFPWQKRAPLFLGVSVLRRWLA